MFKSLLCVARFARSIRDMLQTQAKFAINRLVNRSFGYSPFHVLYGFNPRVDADLAPISGLQSVQATASDIVQHLHDIHTVVRKNLSESNAKYKAVADRHCRSVEFEVGDFVWAVLTKERFPVCAYNKLGPRKIGPR